LHLLPSRILKFSGEGPPDSPPLTGTCPVSTYFQKFSVYLKTFWEPWKQLVIIRWMDSCIPKEETDNPTI
jgi:hypothetical protein